MNNKLLLNVENKHNSKMMKKLMPIVFSFLFAIMIIVSWGISNSETVYADDYGEPTDITVVCGEKTRINYTFTGSNCQNIKFLLLTEGDDKKLVLHTSHWGYGSTYGHYSVEYFGMISGTVYVTPFDADTGTTWSSYKVTIQAPTITMNKCNGQQMSFSFKTYSFNDTSPDSVNIGYYGTSDTIYHGNGLSYTCKNEGGEPDPDNPTSYNKILWQYTYNCTLTLYTNGNYQAMIYRPSDYGQMCYLDFNIHDHINGVPQQENVVNPTCVDSGYYDEVTYCTNCNAKVSSNRVHTDPTGIHEWEDFTTVDVQPTCTKEGIKSYHCKYCSATNDSSPIVALGHDLKTQTTNPTCTTGGVTKEVCKRCDYINIIAEVDPTGHNWETNYTVDVEPTCTTEGTQSYHCKVCDTIHEGTEITIPAKGHNYVDVVIKPTCSQKGYTLHTCSRCEDNYTDSEIAAVGHVFGAWITDADSTCTTEGIQHRECEECGYTETKGVNKKDHSFSNEYTIDQSATCTTDGSKSFHCTNPGCNVVTGSEAIPASGHQYSEWTELKKASCTECGEIERHCSACGMDETVQIEPRGHVWIKTPVIDIFPTHSNEGSESTHCAICDAIKEGSTHSIPALERTSIKGGKLSGIASKVYAGKAMTQKPKLIVDNKILVQGVDYVVTYDNNNTVGKATIVITGIEAYKDSFSKTFTINPKGTTISKFKPAAKAFTVKWKKQANQTTGYQIMIATNSKFTAGKKMVTVTKNSTVSKKITKLKGKKKYYVKVRTYKNVNGTKYYSAWSKAKTVTTK